MARTTSRQHISFSSKVRPAVRIRPGEEVIFEAKREAFHALAEGAPIDHVPFPQYNILTGPVYVDGARPGDLLRVDILDIEITNAWGFLYPGFGPFGKTISQPDVRPLLVDDGEIYISERVRVPLRPHIGSIGVAPAHGSMTGMSASDPTGGNMDLVQMRPGATLWIPVQVEGGLLSLGDLHAAMGDGEALSVAIEAAGRVHTRISFDRTGYQGIHLHLDGSLFFLGNQRKVLQAAFHYLTLVEGLSAFEAHNYIAATVHIRTSGPGLWKSSLLELPLINPLPENPVSFGDTANELHRPKSDRDVELDLFDSLLDSVSG